MKDDFENVYDLIEHAIEYAFEGKMKPGRTGEFDTKIKKKTFTYERN